MPTSSFACLPCLRLFGGAEKMLISLVVPARNEQEVLPAFYSEAVRVARTMPQTDFEFVFIDDGSTDRTIDVLRDLHERDGRVRYASFSRNFGKEAALLAGLREARGDLVAPMDADLQDPPDLLREMYSAIVDEGFDCAAARRCTRDGESRLRSWASNRFYGIFNRLSSTELTAGARDFRLMTRQMVDSVLSVSEYNRFSKGIFGWVGYRTKWIDYPNVERVAGTTKWSLWGLAKYSFDGFVNFSTAPLMLASATGFAFCMISLIWVAVIVVQTLVTANPVPGWPSLACIVLFASGIQLFTIGILGQYLARTYLETKRRPPYIIKETAEQRSSSRRAEQARRQQAVPQQAPMRRPQATRQLPSEQRPSVIPSPPRR